MNDWFKGDIIETQKKTRTRKPTTDTAENKPLGSTWEDVAADNATSGETLKFQTQTNHLHHLYKCEVAKFKSNKAIDGSQPEWQDNEHIHWFHTISSDGKPQVRTNSVGGHYHKIEITNVGEGKAPIARCVSGPMKEVIKMEYGRRKKVEVPVNDVDHHSHEINYVKSNVIVERQRNIEAAKVEAQIQARFNQPMPQGIGEGE